MLNIDNTKWGDEMDRYGVDGRDVKSFPSSAGT
jgi:hypothetical protein